MIIIFVFLSIILLYVLLTYNKFIHLNNDVKEAFSTMDVYLKKRWDLIPNIVETVKGYAQHENKTLMDIISIRNQSYDHLSIEDKVYTNAQMTEKIQYILALAESYPQLQSNKNFMDLQTNLKQIEDEIAQSRKYYNAVIRAYNNGIETFPNNLLAKILNLKSKTMFEASSEERKEVKVKFK